jgi:phosphoglycolate phosphatase
MIEVENMLFDLDGTLIDSREDLARSINLMLEEVGRSPLDEDLISSYVGDGVRVLVYRSLTASHPEHHAPNEILHADGVALMHKHYAEQMFVSTCLYPGVAETLKHFSNKRRAVVTSKETRFVELILDRFGIAGEFDCIIGGDTVPERKPNPLPVIEAIRRLGGQPSATVMIGDSENDINAGRRAETITCGACYGFRTMDQLRKTNPDRLIESIDELKRLFA